MSLNLSKRNKLYPKMGLIAYLYFLLPGVQNLITFCVVFIGISLTSLAAPIYDSTPAETYKKIKPIKLKCAHVFIHPSMWQEKAWELFKKGDFLEANSLINEIQNTLKNGEVAELEYTDKGSSNLIIVSFENGLKAVFKGGKEVHWGANPNAEVAASLIDQALKLNHIPITQLRKIENTNGSVQVYIDADRKIGNGKMLSQIHLFDYFIFNTDRHYQNVLHHKEQVVAIDHGLAFDSEKAPRGNFPPLPFERQIITKEFKEKLINGFTPELINILKLYLTETQLTELVARKDKILAAPTQH